MDRLRTAGVQFDGLDALQSLDRILKVGQSGLKGDPRKEFLKFYCEGVQVAIRGLQAIDEAFYQANKRNIDAAQGPEAVQEALDQCLVRQNGPTIVRRYKLEKLIEQAK